MPVRVLLMAREINLGGSERQLTEIARFLDRSQFDPRVGCFRPAGFYGDQLRQSGVPVVHFPVYSFRSPALLSGARQLARYVRDENVQIVHSFDYNMNVFAVPVTRWFTSAIAVSSQRFHREITPPGFLTALRQTDKIADSVVVNCDFLRRHMVEDERVPPERVEVCHNGINLSYFSPTPTDHGPGLTIGVVCVLRPEKGLSLLLKAFSLLEPVSVPVKLRIIGSGPILGDLQKQASGLGIEQRCIFEPATSDVPSRLRSIDIFVLPSLSEAFSNSLMEAMACGRCVVASDAGGNPELVRDGETGRLFRRGDPESLARVLRDLIADPDARQRLAAGGLSHIQSNFTIQSQAAKMGEIYLKLLARRAEATTTQSRRRWSSPTPKPAAPARETQTAGEPSPRAQHNAH